MCVDVNWHYRHGRKHNTLIPLNCGTLFYLGGGCSKSVLIIGLCLFLADNLSGSI